MEENFVSEDHQDRDGMSTHFPEESEFTKIKDKARTPDCARKKNICYLLEAAQRTAYVYNHKLENRGIDGMVKEGQFREYDIPIKADKIFCSEWLTERTVVMGTKCNKLLVYDVYNREIVQIPSLRGSGDSLPLRNSCGIHAVAVNPSRTTLVTGGEQSNLVALYRLPSFDPICSGDGAHRDWIFDIKWLDDEFFVSGSRDSTIALWKVPEVSHSSSSSGKNPYYTFIKPKVVQVCDNAEKVRAMAFKPDYDLAATSLNGYLHVFDLRTFEQKCSKKLLFQDNVCLFYYEEKNVYAIGSQRNVSFFDSKSLKPLTKMEIPGDQCGIRSLSLRGNILSAGTAKGSVLFYDIRFGRCVEALSCATRKFSLFDERSPLNYLTHPALFSHSCDSSGTRIFVGGGPLAVDFYGCYAAVWQ